MTIIRSKVSQNFTLVSNVAIHDKEFDSKYIGTFLRLISKSEDWEISVSGLAKLYPTNGEDFYRSALKHMCKLGYLIRIPQPRIKGQFQKSIMELYDHRKIEKPLSDEQVEILFREKELKDEEIKEIYPHGVFLPGLACQANPTQQRTKEPSSYSSYKKNKRNNNKQASPEPAAAVVVFSCLKDKDIPQHEKEWLSDGRYTEDQVKHAVAFTEAPQTKITTTYIQTLKWACQTQPQPSKQLDPDSNKQKAIELIRPLEGIDENWEISVMSKEVEFVPIVEKRKDEKGRVYAKNMGKPVYFSYDKKSFWKDLIDFVQFKVPGLFSELQST